MAHDFVIFDDDQYVTQNENVHTGLSWKNITWAFTNISHMCWQPLTWLSHMLDCHVAGLNPAWPHVHNTLLHIANSMILFILFNAMTGARWRSFILALLFAVHPLAVDTVAWVAERKNLLATFFLLLTLLTYWRYVTTTKVRFYLMALFLFCGGLLSKPSVVTLPFLLILLDVWPLERLTKEVPPPHRTEALAFHFASRSPCDRKIAVFFSDDCLYLDVYNFARKDAGIRIPGQRFTVSTSRKRPCFLCSLYR